MHENVTITVKSPITPTKNVKLNEIYLTNELKGVAFIKWNGTDERNFGVKSSFSPSTVNECVLFRLYHFYLFTKYANLDFV